MARNLAIQHLRTTRANLNTQAASNNLKAGEIYLITDENRLAVGLTVSTYETYVKVAEGTTIPSTDGTATGPWTNAFNSGYSSSAIGDLVYLDSSSTWQKCDMDTSSATYSGLVGIALEVKASGNALKVALPGSFVYCTAFPALTIGSPVYMSDAGAIIVAQPSGADDAIRMIGWAVHADKIFFYPSQDYIVHT